MKTILQFIWPLLLGLIATQPLSGIENPIANTTTIVLDGEEVTVHFNDGDTFKAQNGKHARARVRIEGFNALESYGPVHLWMENSAEYLFSMANKATDLARNGFWHCDLDEGKDAYGRLLARCDDLAIALINAGYAHAYSIDSSAAQANYLEAQYQAQLSKKGMWKYGVPDYIITSLHSADEGAQRTYNRLISTKDGHSKKWQHEDIYETCETVCFEEDSCMVYVPFNERYGSNRAECLFKK